jgi:hypothetical protein
MNGIKNEAIFYERWIPYDKTAFHSRPATRQKKNR